MERTEVPDIIQRLAVDMGAVVEHVGEPLPDGSGFAVMSLPLPSDHWLTAETDRYEPPPMPFRMGMADRDEWADKIRAAARYAIRASTMNGRDNDFDPDAMVQNF